MTELIIQDIHNLIQRSLYRNVISPSGIDFASNDYLGMSRDPDILRRLVEFLLEEKQLGATGSRLISGESEMVAQTEIFLAKVFHSPAALVFGSGYLANLGVIQALSGEGTSFFSDEKNHASLIDGMRSVQGDKKIFKHNDLNSLEDILKKDNSVRRVVVTESVFSMDGDSPALESLLDLCNKYNAFLIIDEAHAIGVLGRQGLGLLEAVGDLPENVIAIHPCGKALGTYGAFVNCSHIMRELLINKARTFIFSTALPNYVIAHIRFAVEEILRGSHLREKLFQNVSFFREKLTSSELLFRGCHIGYVSIPGNERVSMVARKLQEDGLFLRAIRAPTVQEGAERLRIGIKSFHSQEELILLASKLREYCL